jgi:hypothetical protein
MGLHSNGRHLDQGGSERQWQTLILVSMTRFYSTDPLECQRREKKFRTPEWRRRRRRSLGGTRQWRLVEEVS